MKRLVVSKETLKHKYHIENKSQDQIAKELGISQWVISDRMRKFKIDRKPKTRNLGKRKYNLNEHFFDKITPNVAWVIGWILSDGNVTSDNYKITINLRREDQKILETIKDLLSYGGPIYKTSSNVKNKVHFGSSLQIGSKHLVKKLQLLVCLSN